jgi:hypothetical protein
LGGCGSIGLSNDLLQALTTDASSAAAAMVLSNAPGVNKRSSGSFITLPLNRFSFDYEYRASASHRRGPAASGQRHVN